MGGYGESVQIERMSPNGVWPSEVAWVTRAIDVERWSEAEERTAQLIARIQPSRQSEERRQAVAEYIKRLITKCTSCKVSAYGSVPLKTYLPDGDIDLTAFGEDESLKDNWANDVREALENEEKNENAEFHVKEVQYIQAEVKIIKCLVEDIVVDISFNQLGGLSTLGFLDEIDGLINHDHLFKRSIILAKAWCYYESRILGAHHGLLSTYALETLVLYIFHVFNNSFAGPLEVLYRFLEFFSNFDWDNYCLSLWGPVPISSLPDIKPEPPRRDSGRVLLNQFYLDTHSAKYAVPSLSSENKSQPFVSKYFNIIDPLRMNNNLGRSVNKGNFFRIRSAFTFGARKLRRIFECSKGDLIAEIDKFFMNTRERHGSEYYCHSISATGEAISFDKTKPNLTIQNITRKHENTVHGFHESNGGLCSEPSCYVPKTIGINQHSQNSQLRSAPAINCQLAPMSSLKSKVVNTESHNVAKENYCSDNTQNHARVVHSMDKNGRQERVHFGRRHSNVEMPCPTDDFFLQDSCDTVQEARNDSSHNSASPLCSLSQSIATETISTSSTINCHAYVRPSGKDSASVSELSSRQNNFPQEEQEQLLENAMMAYHMHNAKQQFPLGLNFTSQPPFSLHPVGLTSLDSNSVNLARGGPPGLPIVDPSSTCLPTSSLSSDVEEAVDSPIRNSDMIEKSVCFSNELNPVSEPEFVTATPDSHIFHSRYLQQPQGGFVSSSHKSEVKRGGYGESDKLCGKNPSGFPNRNSRHRNDNATARNYNVYVPVSQVTTSSSKLNNQTLVDGYGRSSRTGREQRGRKVSPFPVLAYLYGRSKSDWPRDSSFGQASANADDGSLSQSSTLHSSAYEPSKRNKQYSVSSSALSVVSEVQDSRNDSGLVHYATGPPVPFLTMTPVCNIQSEIKEPRKSVKTYQNVHSGSHRDDASNYVDDSEEPGQYDPSDFK